MTEHERFLHVFASEVFTSKLAQKRH